MNFHATNANTMGNAVGFLSRSSVTPPFELRLGITHKARHPKKDLIQGEIHRGSILRVRKETEYHEVERQHCSENVEEYGAVVPSLCKSCVAVIAFFRAIANSDLLGRDTSISSFPIQRIHPNATGRRPETPLTLRNRSRVHVVAGPRKERETRRTRGEEKCSGMTEQNSHNLPTGTQRNSVHLHKAAPVTKWYRRGTVSSLTSIACRHYG